MDSAGRRSWTLGFRSASKLGDSWLISSCSPTFSLSLLQSRFSSVASFLVFGNKEKETNRKADRTGPDRTAWGEIGRTGNNLKSNRTRQERNEPQAATYPFRFDSIVSSKHDFECVKSYNSCMMIINNIFIYISVLLKFHNSYHNPRDQIIYHEYEEFELRSKIKIIREMLRRI